jgi:hypothetical protein
MIRAVCLAALLSAASPAAAYVGPGAAIGLLGWAFGFAGLMAGCVFFVLLYPAVSLYRRYRNRRGRPPR